MNKVQTPCRPDYCSRLYTVSGKLTMYQQETSVKDMYNCCRCKQLGVKETQAADTHQHVEIYRRLRHNSVVFGDGKVVDPGGSWKLAQ